MLPPPLGYLMSPGHHTFPPKRHVEPMKDRLPRPDQGDKAIEQLNGIRALLPLPRHQPSQAESTP
jgi:hypothetical protein